MSKERQPSNFRMHNVPPIIDPVTDEPTLAGTDTSWTEREFPKLAQTLRTRANRLLAGESTYEIETGAERIERTIYDALSEACQPLGVSRFMLIRNSTNDAACYVVYFTNGQGVTHRLSVAGATDGQTLLSHAVSPLPELEPALCDLIAQDMNCIIPPAELPDHTSYDILVKDAPSHIRFVATRANELIQRTLHPTDNIPPKSGRSWGQIE